MMTILLEEEAVVMLGVAEDHQVTAQQPKRKLQESIL
jgi:hypothetical protein